MKNQPLISFVVYISKNHVPTHIEELLASISYLKRREDIQVIFVNSNPNYGIADVIKNYMDELNILYLKTSSDLGQSYAYNLALPYIQGSYCHFLSPTFIVEPMYIETLKKTIANNSVEPDLIVLYNPHILHNYELKELIYKGISKELILGLNSNLKYYVVNTDFLNKSEVKFQEFVFHPLTFVIRLLIDANIISYIPTQIIKSRFKISSIFNAYDIISQTYDIVSILNKDGIYEKYLNEWNYILCVNIYNIFLKVIARSFDIDYSSKNSMKQKSQILQSAISTIRSIIAKTKISLDDNPYIVKNRKSIFEVYDKVTKVIK